jgi:hypothetical protein
MQNRLDTTPAFEAAKILETRADFLEYYAWPQTFGSTSGPFGGIGGQAITTFTIEAFSDGRDAVLFCKGRKWKIVRGFSPNKAVTTGY